MPDERQPPAEPIARNHHYIPQFHLRGFAAGYELGGGRMLMRFDKQTGIAARLSVKRAAVVKDLYGLPPESGHAADELERNFAGIEGIVAPIIRWMRSLSEPGHHAMDAPTRDAVAGYLAMLYIRSPTYGEPRNRLASYIASIDIDMLLSNPERFAARLRATGWAGSDPELEAYRLEQLAAFRSGRLFLEAPPIASMADLRLAVDHLRPVMIARRWILYLRERWPYLLVGDQAVLLLGSGGAPRRTGFALEDTQILVPLGSECLLVMTTDANDGSIEVVTPDRADPSIFAAYWWAIANAAAWQTAGRFIFARCAADLEATRLVLNPAERLFSLPGPAIGGGDPAWAGYAERLGIRELGPDEI